LDVNYDVREMFVSLLFHQLQAIDSIKKRAKASMLRTELGTFALAVNVCDKPLRKAPWARDREEMT